jgi:hypothetical protein
MPHPNWLTAIFFIMVLTSCSESPQQADPSFKPKNTVASFAPHHSPTVIVDNAHNNFLSITGRYKPFAQVLRSDGFIVRANTEKFTLKTLSQADVLVIANALDKPRKDWHPPYNQALHSDEVTAITDWVAKGGALMLIADHTPFPKVIENLAQSLGFTFSNGHVKSAIFRKTDRSLTAHITTYPKESSTSKNGIAQFSNTQSLPFYIQQQSTTKPAYKQVTHVKTFGGSAFTVPKNALSLLNLGRNAISIEPAIPFQVNATTPRIAIDGWSQGAVLTLGKGRVAVFSEGMMFSSQRDTTTGNILGMTSSGAEQNESFLLNIMHWLVDVGV